MRCSHPGAILATAFCLFILAPAFAQSFSNLRKHLIMDPRLVETTENLRLSPGAIEKDPRNPLFAADKPWENALNNLYPNVIYDEQEKLFKLWYKCVLFDKDVIAKMAPPRTIHNVGWFLLYATSKDGIAWEKPELGLISFDGSTRNNIVARDTPNVGVFKDNRDPDPSRRYKMIYDIARGSMLVRFSPDGIHWSQPLTPTGLGPTGDTHNAAFWDPLHEQYVLITREFIGQRLVYRSESRDFLAWQEPTLILRSSEEEGAKRQTYCMPSFPYASGYVGFVMMYNAGGDQKVDCELTYSPDSVHWKRVFPGQSFIPLGPKNAYDSACIYAQANSPILRDGKLWIYYGGSDFVHRGWKRHCLPCLARLRVDGFAFYEPVDARASGFLVTAPLPVSGEMLKISADARGGSVRAEIVDAGGFTLDPSNPITEDVTDAPITWKGGRALADLKRKTVRLRFELNRAKLYAISF